MGVDNWDPEVEQAFALALAPKMKEIAAYIKTQLPPTTDFAVLIGIPAPEVGALGRVLAISTNRERMAFLAAQWSLSAHELNKAEKKADEDARRPPPPDVKPNRRRST